MKKIVICGSKGKCGKEVYRLLKQEGYQILDCVNEHEQSLQEVIAKHQSIDWVIDFTNKEVAYKHLLLCIQYHLPFICGTTGFSNQELKYIQEACQKINLKGIISNTEEFFGSNPALKELSAVKEGRLFYLENRLFNLKPNAKWGESYEKLANILSGEND